jgi:hypothetical protein
MNLMKRCDPAPFENDVFKVCCRLLDARGSKWHILIKSTVHSSTIAVVVELE